MLQMKSWFPVARIAFITPTRDRPEDLRRMLQSLENQTRRPDQVIVVDASTESVGAVCREFPTLGVNYLRWTAAPSAAAQRNGGLALLKPEIDWICFFDDDQVLYPDALEKAVDFILGNQDHVFGGLAFCCTDYEKENRSFRWKDSRLARKLGLYAPPGQVAPSGWQSVIRHPRENLALAWMSSSAMMLKREILQSVQFDNFFPGVQLSGGSGLFLFRQPEISSVPAGGCQVRSFSLSGWTRFPL